MGCARQLPGRARNDEIVYNVRILPGLACRGSARRHFCQQRSPGQTNLWTMACRAADGDAADALQRLTFECFGNCRR